MTRDLLIGIDAGTSVIKSVAFTRRGEQIACFALPNTYESIDGVGAEQDMARTWSDTAATLRGLAGLVPDLARRTAAIAVTAQGDGTWLIDDDGRPVAPAWLWLDARAGDIAQTIRDAPEGRAIFERTGSGVNACQQGTQLLWLKRHRPDVVARATTALHCKDWLYFKLTGVRACDPSESIFTYGNMRTRAVDPAVVAALGLTEEARLIPPIIDGMREIGELTDVAAREIGFEPGLPIVLGYVDVITTILGAGLFDPEAQAGCTVIGSTGMHARLASSIDNVVLNPDCTGYTMAFPIAGAFAQLQSNMASTINIDWLLDLARGVLSDHDVAISRRDLLAGVDARVLSAEPGSLIFHPYISEAGERGPFVDPTARAQFLGLSVRHGYSDLMRAVFEGLAFAARDCYAVMGGVPAEIRVTGGAARSKAMRTIMGGVLGARIRTSSREEAGAAGVAMIAAVALGFYPDLSACAEDWVRPLLQPALDPDPVLVDRYDRLFPAYVAGRKASAPVWHALHEQRRERHHG
ncbi:carbohydrate kinase [Lichenihabitans sp. PAMC28606]|uniref:FGGY-family carbohydrate kinase n=1 Tax=Lichenihabitans sp. PAMC28606 TaxID=2880932 RepID=UPI001D0A6273|nr:FGGY-family carbohydrate kinase [Lichenihabitans sp. PAMC28606]UDL93018.1 carbohydrate kinase [Lichenihabitans sp. PAMC28606]